MSAATPEKQTVQCSCHCGKIKFTFIAPPKGEDNRYHATRCNCTFCTKLCSTNLQLPNHKTDFTLQSPSSKDQIASYVAGKSTVERYFCSTCSVHCWMEGSYEDPQTGEQVSIFVVNLISVDQPQDGFDLSEVGIKYYNMLVNDWTGGLADKPWKGGLL